MYSTVIERFSWYFPAGSRVSTWNVRLPNFNGLLVLDD